MKKQTIFFSLISALLLAACTNKTAYSTMLAQADSLLTSQPDSALRILQSIPTEDLKTEANIAYLPCCLHKHGTRTTSRRRMIR
ncbi:hypothetical protein [Bacteroides heparinolyticus]|uniref:hypothetical protein n=1 Tax=Prevotella heparinolytica TaxID=28113 RepID=UPI0028EBC5BB|nr:hypothetical protein [Bacteroides heparinolyticus]